MTTAVIGSVPWFWRTDVRSAMQTANLTEQQLFTRARQEADGLAGWASWKPGTDVSPRGSANINVNVPAMLAADFELTTE